MALSSCHAVAQKAFTSRIVKLAAWDVTADLVTIYDKLHADALDYVTAADPAAARRIAESLRSMLEKFVRIAYPQYWQAACLANSLISRGSASTRLKRFLGQRTLQKFVPCSILRTGIITTKILLIRLKR